MKKISILVLMIIFNSVSNVTNADTNWKKIVSDGVKVATKTVQVIDDGYSEIKETLQSDEVQSQLDSLKIVTSSTEMFQDAKEVVKTVTDSAQNKGTEIVTRNFK